MDFCAFILVCFPEAGPVLDWVATQYVMLASQVESLEFQLQDVEFCLAGGNSGPGVLRAPPGLN